MCCESLIGYNINFSSISNDLRTNKKLYLRVITQDIIVEEKREEKTKKT